MSTPGNQHADGRRAADRDPAEIAAWYRSQFGWNVQVDGTMVRLVLDHGMMAFFVPFERVTEILWAWRRLDLHGPVLLLRGAAAQVVLLADSNDLVLSQQDLPAGTGLLRAPSWLLLPSGEGGSAAPRWLTEPQPATRWLPSATAVLRAVIMANSVQGRLSASPGPATPTPHGGQAGHTATGAQEPVRRRIA